MKEEKKLVPKRRFKGFEGEWKKKSFSDLAEIVRGASPRPIEDPKWFDSNSEVGWLRISDVSSQNGRITYLEQRISSLAEEKTRVLNDSHLLISIAATVGKPVINYVKTGVHDGFLIFLSPRFDIEYMYQWLEMFRPNWKRYGQPGSQVNLNSDIIKNHIVLLPSLKEQQKIGQFFKLLDERIANQEKRLAKIKSLKSAYLTDMFPQKGETVPKRRFRGFEGEWETYRLLDVADIIGGGTPSTSIKEYWGGDIDWYSPTEIGTQVYASNSIKKITRLGLDKSSATILPANRTILFTSRAGIGDMAILTKSATTNQGFQSLVIKNSFDVYFIYSMGYKIKEYALRNASGSTFLEISGNELEKMEVIIPSYKEQQKIGEFFKNLDDQIATEERKLAKLKAMKEAYLAEMFV